MAESERVPVSEIAVGDFVPYGLREWARVRKIEHLRSQILIYVDDPVLRNDPLRLPETSEWARRVSGAGDRV